MLAALPDTARNPWSPPLRRLLPVILLSLLALVLVVVAAGIGAILYGPRWELAGFAARRATAALGREVTIGSLHVTPGRWLRVEVRDARLANIPGGTQPEMATLGRLSAEVEARSLLFGPPVLRAIALEDAALLLEKAADHTRNWRFGPPRLESDRAVQDRSGLPLLTAATIRNSQVVIRTTSGHPLTAKIAELTIAADDAARPVALRVEGSWQATPITLHGTLDPIAVLRDATKPYGAALRATSGKTELDFTGTATDPLNADGLAGRLHLRAPSLEELLASAGAGAVSLDAALDLAGGFTRQDDIWRLTDGTGTLAGSPLKAPLLELHEGASGKPDAVKVELDIAHLNLNRILRGGGKDGDDADMPLVIEANPDPMVQARLKFGELTFNRMRASAVSLVGAIEPGRVAVEEFGLTLLSARLTGSAHAEPADPGPKAGAHLAADVALLDGDLDTLRRAFGLRAIPVSGRLTGRFAATAQASHLAQALGTAKLSAVLALASGSVAREVIQAASQDLRLLFRSAEGTTPVTCMLAVGTLNAGVGQVAPLRIRSNEGTISGIASFDLNRKQVDLVIGSEAATTGSFALDIPIRAYGSFAAPTIRPASWSADGRARLAAENAVVPMPPALRSFAQRNPCFTANGPASPPPARGRARR